MGWRDALRRKNKREAEEAVRRLETLADESRTPHQVQIARSWADFEALASGKIGHQRLAALSSSNVILNGVTMTMRVAGDSGFLGWTGNEVCFIEPRHPPAVLRVTGAVPKKLRGAHEALAKIVEHLAETEKGG